MDDVCVCVRKIIIIIIGATSREKPDSKVVMGFEVPDRGWAAPAKNTPK